MSEVVKRNLLTAAHFCLKSLISFGDVQWSDMHTIEIQAKMAELRSRLRSGPKELDEDENEILDDDAEL